MFGLPLNYVLAIVLGVVGVGWTFRAWIPGLFSGALALVKRSPVGAKTSDESDLAALKQLCPRYKGDPEGEKAILILKERFLLVPGAAQ